MNAAVPTEYQVLMALRFYASGCFQNLVSDMINVDRTTACRAIRKVSVVLQRRLQQYVYMPRDQRQTQYIKEKFYNLAHFPNVVACVEALM